MQKYPFLTLKLVQGPDLRFNPKWSSQHSHPMLLRRHKSVLIDSFISINYGKPTTKCDSLPTTTIPWTSSINLLGLPMQTDTYWFGFPRGPSWAFQTPISPCFSRMSLKMGNVRLYLVITTTI
jgi:hypothetical protein